MGAPFLRELAVPAVLGGCAGPALPPQPPVSAATAPTPAVKPETAAPQGEQLLAQVEHALAAQHHPCSRPDAATLVCDHEDPNRPTLVVVLVSRGKLTRLAFTSSFPWKAPDACEKSAGRLNELNRSNDLLKAFCTDELLTWMSPLVVPRGGVTDDDITGFTAWFAASVQATLHESQLVPLLK
jgi:hypothetical protein